MIRVLTILMFALFLQSCVTADNRESERPDNMLVVYQAAMKSYADGDMQAAESGLRQITKYVPKDSVAWFRLGNVYARTGRPNEAVNAYREALVRDPGRTKAWHNMGVIQLRQAAKSFVELQVNAREYDRLKAKANLYELTIMEMLGEAKKPATNIKAESDDKLDSRKKSGGLILESADNIAPGNLE